MKTAVLIRFRALFDYARFGRRFDLGVWLVVAAIAVSALIYVWNTASPVVLSDNWYYTDTLVKHYQEGKLGFIDIFGKRPNDNSQPLNRLILLGLTRWFHMDLLYQGMLGTLVALACVLLLSWIAWRAWPRGGATPWTRALLPVGFAAILLSLNPVGLFTWPLVTTLTYIGSLGAILYLYAVGGLAQRGRWGWAWAAAGALPTLLFIDTFGILAVIASVILFAHRAAFGPREQRLRNAATAVAVFLALMVYQQAYRHLTKLESTPLNGANIGIALRYIAAHLDEAWKTLVVPFAMSVYQPLGRLGLTWPVLVPLAFLVWCGHLWFWREYLRNSDSRVAFLGAGLMLYFYGTVAGMLLDRVPQNDFDYFFQPRYAAFYELQLVAMLLMVAVVFPRRVAPPRTASLVVILVAAMLAFNVYFVLRAWVAAPSLRNYDARMVQQINQLVLDPSKPPEICYPLVLPCRWPLQRRLEVLQILRDGDLNILSPEFRAAHGYQWTEPAAQKPAAGAPAP